MTGAAAMRVAGPPAGLVDVWAVRVNDAQFAPERILAALDAGERQHAARLRIGGRAWAAAHGARRVILAGYLGVPAGTLQFCAGESGKPRLVDVTGLEFSFAHTAGLALLAVAGDREVGVDVERENARTDIESVAHEFLPAGVAAALARTPAARRRSAFFTAWVEHEARIKLHGHALTETTAGAAAAPHAPVAVRALAVPPGFAAAVAAPGSDWTVRMRTLSHCAL